MHQLSDGKQIRNLALLPLILFLSAACHKSSSDSNPVPIPPVAIKLTKDNYLNGKQFCQTYSSVTSTEFGQYVPVPKDYDHPGSGTLQIYVYSMSKFDPKKPSYIYVDGGPGQNTHGSMPDFLGGKMNELRFDQRGLGCSAPDTWEEYIDPTQYSSKNNIRDMEEIRKALGIDKWTIYGVSYGTVPATMYSHTYAEQVTSTVLEGVAGGAQFMDNKTVLVQRDHYNKVWNALNEAQKKSFATLLADKEDSKVILFLLIQIGAYYDHGIPEVIRILKVIIKDDGTVDRVTLGKLSNAMNNEKESKPHPQAPGEVDSNILTIIYCKNLGAMKSGLPHLSFDPTTGFLINDSSDDESKSECEAKGVKSTDVDDYEPTQYSIKNPVYYFQGQMDSATPALGALHHRDVVPQGKSYFMLANDGGHNPNLTRITAAKDSSNLNGTSESTNELSLFSMALNAQEITSADVDRENAVAPNNQAWQLFLANTAIDPSVLVSAIKK